MSYIPHTEVERQQMLAAIGVTTIEDLFEAVPATHRFPQLNLPAAMSEMDIVREMSAMAEANEDANDFVLFRGAGAYHHFIPSVVNHVILRGEFLTAYTPYQPEISQGTLQSVYEYQSMMCALTGMDAANASHYDGATSLAEAVTVAYEVARGKRKKIIFSHAIHPQYRDVARTYNQGRDTQFVGDDQARSLIELADLLDDQTAMLAVSYPNFFGQIEDLTKLAEQVHKVGALLCVVTNPMALGLLKPPGEMGADMVVGEGQTMGIPLSFGGPYLGFFSVKQKYVRKIAGRIVGETTDADGKKAYVMTLRPREQDIRREKASSNICTNQGLMALAASVYMALMGRNGLKKVASLNYHKAHYAAQEIDKVQGFSVLNDKPFFNEFVIKCPRSVAEVNAVLVTNGIIGGIDLSAHYPDMKDHMLMAVTEMNSKEEIDLMVEVLRSLV